MGDCCAPGRGRRSSRTDLVGIAKEGEDGAIAAGDGRAKVEGLFDLVSFVELVQNMDAGLFDLVEEDIVKVALCETTHDGSGGASGASGVRSVLIPTGRWRLARLRLAS